MSIPSDDIADTGLSDSAAVEQLMEAMSGPKGSKPENDEGDDDQDEGDEGEEHLEADEGDDDDQDEGEDAPDDEEGDDDDAEEGDEEEGEEGDEKPEEKAAAEPLSDDAVVKVMVDGEETEHTIGSLKRLAGQEASLTRKSQEADVVGGRAAAALQGALESVLEDLQPYANVDWVLEGQRMDPEEFQWHREQFNRLNTRYGKIVKSAQDFDKSMGERRTAASAEAAQAALKELADPKTGIEGWNDGLYRDILTYGVESGLDRNDVANITSPAVLKLIHKAMLHDRGKKAVAEKVNNAPRKVRKGPGREAIKSDSAKSQRTLERKIKAGTASEDDAIKALVGRWG